MSNAQIFYTRLHCDAIPPHWRCRKSLSYELSIFKMFLMPSGLMRVLQTGLRIQPPDNCILRIDTHQSLASKSKAVIILSHFTIGKECGCELRLNAINVGSNDTILHPGERVARLYFQPICIFPAVETFTPKADHCRGKISKKKKNCND